MEGLTEPGSSEKEGGREGGSRKKGENISHDTPGEVPPDSLPSQRHGFFSFVCYQLQKSRDDSVMVEEMGQWLRAHMALPEDPRSVASTCEWLPTTWNSNSRSDFWSL